MNRSNRIFIPLVASLIVCVSCKNDDALINDTSPSFIMPLKVGNTWIRLVTSYDTAGTIVLSKYDTVRISSDTTIEGETWYNANGLVTNRSTGLWIRNGSQNYLLAKYPAAVHDTYATIGNDTVTVLSKNAYIIVAGGKFTCYQYRISNGSTGTLESMLYLAVNKGLIKQTNYDTTNGSIYIRDVAELQKLVLY